MRLGNFIVVGLLVVMGGIARGQSMPAATSPGGDVDAAALEEIGVVRNGITAALNKGDIDGAMAFVDPQVVVTWANGEVSHGRDEVKAYCQRMTSGPDKMVESMTISPVVEGRKMYGGNVLISYGTLGDVFKLSNGEEFTLNSRFSSLLVKEDGKWRMKGFHASADVFDNPILRLAMKKTAIWVGIGAGVAGILIGLLLGKILRRGRAAA